MADISKNRAKKTYGDYQDNVALEIINLTRYYTQGSFQLEVLKGINLKVVPGEMVGLVGPSGSGKSTLLHLAGLLEKPSAGKIYLQGRDSEFLSERERTDIRLNDIGFVYQFHHLLPEFSAIENVMIPQLIAGLDQDEAHERAQQLLSMVGLSERLDHKPASLSGGEQQRVAIVRSMANVPRLILADEPTGNLDAQTSLEVFEQLREIVKASHVATLIATHNVELTSRMDRVIKMEAGKLMEL